MKILGDSSSSSSGNCMSEFMGLIYGAYDAKKGFQPGGASLHSMMTPHGPDAKVFKEASQADLRPVKLEGTQAFMFESSLSMAVTEWGEMGCQRLDQEYYQCWQDIPKTFNPSWEPEKEEGLEIAGLGHNSVHAVTSSCSRSCHAHTLSECPTSHLLFRRSLHQRNNICC